MIVIKIGKKCSEDILPGGLADKNSPSDFDPKHLAKSTKVEMEHVNDKKIAQEIAMDHLTEDPKYYDKLKKIETESLADSRVKIYRALPATTTEIRHDDYVTLSRKFAGDHAVTSAVYNEEPFYVVWAFVAKTDIVEASNPGEYKYMGKPFKAKASQIANENGVLKWLKI